LKKLIDENGLLRRLVDNLDKELKWYRAKPFFEEDFEGVSIFDRDLINPLRSGESIGQLYAGMSVTTPNVEDGVTLVLIRFKGYSPSSQDDAGDT
jgi:hypothetical protein